MAEGADKIDTEPAETSDDIRARIEETRVEMSQTIDEIEARLSPRGFLAGGRAAIVPVMAAGLALLAVVAYRRRRARLKRSYRYVRW